jgi:hypothetical protein
MAALYRSLLLGILASILIFTFFPQIDLATTRLFHAAGEGFPLARLGWVDAARRLHMSLAWAAGLERRGLALAPISVLIRRPPEAAETRTQ